MRRLAVVLAAVALMILPRVAKADGESGPISEQEFIALAGAPQRGDDQGGEAGRPAEPAEKKGESLKDEGDANGEEDPDGEGAGGGSDEGAGEGGASDDEDPDGEDEGAGGGSGDDEGTGAGEGGESHEEDPDGEGAGGGSDEDKAFEAALEAEGASVSLESLPKAARPIVEKVVKDLRAGFTRATQRLAEERKNAAQFRAEERFRKEQPANYIVSLLMENPDLSDAVNTIIEDMRDNATAAAGHKAVVEEGRRKAADAEGKAQRVEEARVRTTERIVSQGRAAAKAYGVPFEDGLEAIIAAHVFKNGDITSDEIKTLAKKQAHGIKAVVREQVRTASRSRVQGKVEDRRRAGLKVKPGSGLSPQPGGKKMPANDAEFAEEFAGRL